ncbi:MAG: cell division protein FtsA [Bacteroidales bacterium]|nr:cell division protein FtsA [Bacteroidales bacterium]
MTTKNRIVAAVDIGTTKVVAILGIKDEFGKLNVLGCGEAETNGVIHGSVQNVGEVARAVKMAVNRCKTSAGMQQADIKNVFVGIAGQNIRDTVYSHSKCITDGNDTNGRTIVQGDVDSLTEEVYNLSKEPGEEIIHVIPLSFHVDLTEVGLNPVGFVGRKLVGDFYVAVGKVNSVRNIRLAFEMAGFNIVKIILEPLASAEAVLTDEEKEAGVLVADIGGGTTDIAVFQDKTLAATSFVPFGGVSVTNDINSACHLIPRQAEALKLQYGYALCGKDFKKKLAVVNAFGRSTEISFADLANIINARLDEILGGIAHFIESRGYSGKLPAGVVLTGGSALMKNISQLTRFRLGVENVRIGGVRTEYLSSGGDNTQTVKYSAAVGLLIKGSEYYDRLDKMKKMAEEKRVQNPDAPSGGGKKDSTPSSDKKVEETKEKSGGFWNKIKSFANGIAKDFLTDSEGSKV